MKTVSQKEYTEAVLLDFRLRYERARLQGPAKTHFLSTQIADDAQAETLEWALREFAICPSEEQVVDFFACLAGGLATFTPFDAVLNALKHALPVFESCRGYCDQIREHATKLAPKPESPRETLSEKDVAALDSGKCPDCGGESFIEGPHGGMNVNIKCGLCGSKFNVVPGLRGAFGKERI